MPLERIIIALSPDGSFRGASAQTFDGLPAPLDASSLSALFPGLNTAALARVTELTDAAAQAVLAHEAALEELRAELTQQSTAALEGQATSMRTAFDLEKAQAVLAATGPLQNIVDDLSAQLDALRNPPAPDSLSVLNAAFQQIPAELQPKFAAAYATVRVLVIADQVPLAAAFVAGLEVPEELEAVKQSVLSTLTA